MSIVLYKNIPCHLAQNWWDGQPIIQLAEPSFINKALELGFETIGHPNEIVKILTKQEYQLLTTVGRID